MDKQKIKYSELSKIHIDKIISILGDKQKYKYNENGGADFSAVENNYRPVEGRVGGKAKLILFPVAAEEVSEVLKYCNKNKIKVFTQGGNSGLVGGSTPDDSGNGVVIKLTRMNKILSDINDNIATVKVQAGVIIDSLNEKLNAFDLFCSIKHGGTGSATAGGNVATNSGGENAIKYGVTKDQVIGLTVVTASGAILNLGGNMKDTTAYLMSTFIGSEGALGIITEVEFKVYNKPKNLQTALVSFDDISYIAVFLARLKKEFGKDGIEAFEFMNNFIFNQAKAITGGAAGLPVSGNKKAYVLFEVSSSSISDDMQARLADFLEKNKNLIDFDNALLATSQSERNLYWNIREHCTDASNGFAGVNAVRFDTCVPLDKIAVCLKSTEAKLHKQFPTQFNAGDFQYVAFGHWGDGNIHQHIIQNKEKAGLLTANKNKIEDIVLKLQVSELGGTASAEHGFGRLSGRFKYYPEALLNLMGELKNTLDPNKILNPGIGLPDMP